MDCACYDASNGDMVTVLTNKYPTARKVHICKECYEEVIAPGDTYHLETYSYDGFMETHKTCLDCESVRKHLFCGFCFGELWQDLFDNLDYYGEESIPWSDIAKLTKQAREKVLDYIERKIFDDEKKVR